MAFGDVYITTEPSSSSPSIPSIISTLKIGPTIPSKYGGLFSNDFKNKFYSFIVTSNSFSLYYPDEVSAITKKEKVAEVSFFIVKVPSIIYTKALSVVFRLFLDLETRLYLMIGQFISSELLKYCFISPVYLSFP